MKLTVKQAQDLVNNIEIPEGFRILHPLYNQEPFFPDNRKDVCAIRRALGNNYHFAYDTIYLVWKNKEGIHYDEVVNSKNDSNYGWELPILEVREWPFGIIKVSVEEKRPFSYEKSRKFNYYLSGMKLSRRLKM